MGKHMNKWLNDLLGDLKPNYVEKFGHKLIFYKDEKDDVLLQYSLNIDKLWVNKEKIWDVLLEMTLNDKLVQNNIRKWVYQCYDVKPNTVEYSYGSDLNWWKNQK